MTNTVGTRWGGRSKTVTGEPTVKKDQGKKNGLVPEEGGDFSRGKRGSKREGENSLGEDLGLDRIIGNPPSQKKGPRETLVKEKLGEISRKGG